MLYTDPDLIVENGQLTFDAEGNDNPKSAYFSRKLHVPSAWSGITVGRGYDIKYKSYKTVLKDLTKVGVDGKIAKKIARGVGKRGKRAKKYIKVCLYCLLAVTPYSRPPPRDRNIAL